MPNYTFVFVLLLMSMVSVVAQENCYKDPSCQHTKAMLLEAQRQWDNQSEGINTNARSEAIDILHYEVDLDMTNFGAAEIKGFCTVTLAAKKANVKQLELDLLEMNVDSVTMGGKAMDYTYNDTLLQLQFKEALVLKDTVAVTVYYHGVPQEDKQWGGFYYKGNYAYNLGVGFAADPHNYGRVWHPCFDNFAERAMYTFRIKTQEGQRAHCNGYLQSEHILDGVTTRIWKMEEAIPTYLACIAVGDYTIVKQEHQGVDGMVPIELVSEAVDTANLKASFQNLPKAIAAYEYWYGPHRWSKVGYSLVPFRSGAMEHATNIAYPISAADGSKRKESLMAHELGHSWWGNLVTCERPSEMWINEGMASYSVHLFWEHAYGRERYLRAVKDNHYTVLKYAHQREKGYRPISGVPHQYTYGMHVYDKGAAVAHNMRWYMGDENFRKGLQAVTKQYQFKNLNSPQFRDALSYATGIDMTAFFDDWVFQGGYPHFEIAKQKIKKTKEGYEVELDILQKLVGRETFLKAVPLQVTCLDKNENKYQAIVNVSGKRDKAVVQVPFKPQSIVLNEEHGLNQARFDAHLKMDTIGAIQLDATEVELWDFYVHRISSPAWLQLEHHPVPPSAEKLPEGFLLSSTHYWSVRGVLSDETEVSAAIEYDPKWDLDLNLDATKDSLVLLYRPVRGVGWQVHPDYVKWTVNGNATIRFSVLEGDYALGKGKHSMTVAKAPKVIDLKQFDVQQKANTVAVTLAAATTQKVCVEWRDMKGTCLQQKASKLSPKAKTIQLPHTKSGIYFFKIKNNKGKIVASKRVVVK